MPIWPRCPRCTRRRGSGLSAWPGGGCWQVGGWALKTDDLLRGWQGSTWLRRCLAQLQRLPLKRCKWPHLPAPCFFCLLPQCALLWAADVHLWAAAGAPRAQRAPAGAARPDAQPGWAGHSNGRYWQARQWGYYHSMGLPSMPAGQRLDAAATGLAWLHASAYIFASPLPPCSGGDVPCALRAAQCPRQRLGAHAGYGGGLHALPVRE